MQRKGIAPVVATIILVLIVIVAAGGAFTWISQIIQDQIGDADRERNREVVVRDIQCSSGGNTVEYLLVNSGSINLNGNSTNIYVYNSSNGNLWATTSAAVPPAGASDGYGTFDAGTQADTITDSGATDPTFTGITFQSGAPVNVQFEFTNADGFTVSAQCSPS